MEQFIHEHWRHLRFSPALQVEKREGRKLNPKRLRRVIEKEIAASASRGTKAQQALAEQREAYKLERKAKSKAERQEEKDRKFWQRSTKRKEKHRGH